ncbi:SDA1-like protein [Trifolium medium]|uniref:Protein SDA1 n=1 Tax=Trifolium medium TaxID=97028 RepID=A0A392NKD2_9FABA|nr:SDA1-like protein [Trifolium medium]
MSHEDEQPGCVSEKQNLRSLLFAAKENPDGHISDLRRIHSEFNSYVDLFHLQESLTNFKGYYPKNYDPTVHEKIAERALILSHLAGNYPDSFFGDFPSRIFYLLQHSLQSFPSTLRIKLAEALTLLVDFQVLLP